MLRATSACINSSAHWHPSAPYDASAEAIGGPSSTASAPRMSAFSDVQSRCQPLLHQGALNRPDYLNGFSVTLPLAAVFVPSWRTNEPVPRLKIGSLIAAPIDGLSTALRRLQSQQRRAWGVYQQIEETIRSRLDRADAVAALRQQFLLLDRCPAFEADPA
jgi:hypothetical protein